MIFIDTNAFVAFFRNEDAHHEKAVKIFEKISSGILGNAVISDYVFDETVTVVLSRTNNKDKAVGLGKYMMQSAKMLKVHKHVFNLAWKLFKENKVGLSFTDCTNIALMKLFNINHIATFDEAFKKVGGINVVDS